METSRIADELCDKYDQMYFAVMRQVLETIPVLLPAEISKPIGGDCEDETP